MLDRTSNENDRSNSQPECFRVCPQTRKINLRNAMPALALHSFSKAIEIPASLRNQPLDAWQTSARLSTVLERFGIHFLGDLHGRKVVDFAWEKNCGPKTLYELDLLARRARFRNGTASGNGHRRDYIHASNGFTATDSEGATAKIHKDATSFVIPESICHLAFNELPITTRLGNVVRSIGARNLGDLNGRSAFELLQYKACGWATISEIQQLIERAISGEFDVAQIEEATATAELLNLLEQGLAKLPLRERQFLLARIGAQTGTGRSPGADLLCLTYAEIGRRYGLTRARIHKVLVNTLDSLRRTWGPRVPRLLEVLKWRCLSAVCPLTPKLLEKWVGSSAAFSSRPATGDCFNSFRLSMEAHMRLIAALDKSIPYWPETNHKLPRTDDPGGQFDLTLARVVREAGGQITVAEAYRRLSHPDGRHCRRLTVETFLQMLRSVEGTVVEVKNPEVPIVSLRSLNGGVLFRDVPGQNGKSSTPRKTPSNLAALQFFGTKNSFCERQAVRRR
jgi:hypothetical protein